MSRTCCRILLLGLLALCCAAMAWAAGDVARGLGLTFKSLEAEDLDIIAQQLGRRVGVMVEAVADGSAAAKAGFKQGDIVFTIGKTGVDSREAAEKALDAASGAIEVVGMRIGAEKTDALQLKLTLPEKAGAKPEPARPEPAGDDTAKKLQALDDAHKAGILSDEEYAQKKDALLKAAKPAELSPETKKKLQALEDARKAGVISDEEYAKKRAALLKAEPAAAKAADVPGARKGKTYNHVIGFSFWYPDTWTVKEADDGLQLVPANPAMLNGAPAEAFAITGQPLEGTGITAVNDPRVLAFLDQLVMTKISPYLQRKAAPTAVPMTNGQGLRAEWEATGQGNTVCARIYACVLKNYGVIFFGFGPKDKLQARDADLQAIFASFGFEAGKQDPAVVGTWALFSSRYLRNEDNLNFKTDDPQRATMATDEREWLELRADGTAVHTSVSRSIAGGGAAGGNTKVWIDTGDQKSTKEGRWNAGNGTLFVLWADGSMSTWTYERKDAALTLQAGSRVEEWKRQ
jgi:hypothetical protein